MAEKKSSNSGSNPDYKVDYNDERLTSINADKQAAINDSNATYDQMINSVDGYYQQQIDNTQNWADKQVELQNEQTDFAIEQIEQQKDQAKKDYQREQSGAYTDYKKQSNGYGVGAEQRAAGGLTNTGFSESSQVAMYNTYQNRVATARESYNTVVMNYNNAIKDARLQNNYKLAEIAYQAQQTSLELALQGFQYKNQLVLDKANKKLEIDNMYYGRYKDMLSQINTENAFAFEQQQHNDNMAMKDRELTQQQSQFDANLDFQKQQHKDDVDLANKELAQKDQHHKDDVDLANKQLAQDDQHHKDNLKLNQDQLKEEQRQHNENYDLAVKEFAEEVKQNAKNHKLQVKQLEEMIRQFNKTHALDLEKFAQSNKEFEKQYELAVKEFAEQVKQNATKNDFTEKEFNEMVRQFNEKMKLEMQNFNSGGGGKKGENNVGDSGNPLKVKDEDNGTDEDVAPQSTTVNEPKVDMSSINKLGYGPISVAKADDLVRSGKVVKVNENGVIKYYTKEEYEKKTNTSNKPNKNNTISGQINQRFGW